MDVSVADRRPRSFQGGICQSGRSYDPLITSSDALIYRWFTHVSIISVNTCVVVPDVKACAIIVFSHIVSGDEFPPCSLASCVFQTWRLVRMQRSLYCVFCSK